MSTKDEQELKDLFGDLRRREAAGAPSFRAVRDADRRRPARAARALWAVPVAAAVALAVILGVGVRSSRPPVPRRMPAAVEVSSLDFLLDTPGERLLRQTPRVDLAPVAGLSGIRWNE